MRKLIKIGFAISIVALFALTTVSFAADTERGDQVEPTDLNSDLNQELNPSVRTTPPADSDDNGAADTPVATGDRADSDRVITERRGRSASRSRTASDDRGEKWWWSHDNGNQHSQDNGNNGKGGKGGSPGNGGKDDD